MLAVIDPDCPFVRSLRIAVSPACVSWMSTVTVSPGCIISTFDAVGVNVALVCPSGSGGPTGLPLLVMNAKLAGSMPTVSRQSSLFETPLFWFRFSWNMATAAHHFCGSQLTPGGHFTQPGG